MVKRKLKKGQEKKAIKNSSPLENGYMKYISKRVLEETACIKQN